MEIITVKDIEAIAINHEIGVRIRVFAAGRLLATYTSVRFADVR